MLIWHSSDKVGLLRIMFASLACGLPLDALLCCLRISDEPTKYVGIGVARLALQVACSLIFLVAYRLGLVGALWSSTLAGTAVAIVLLALKLTQDRGKFDTHLFGRMIRYSFPSIFVGLCSFLMHMGDRYFLQRYVSLAELAVYALAYKMGMLVTLVQYVFQSYWNAQVFKVAQGPQSEIAMGRALTYLTSVLCWCAVAIIAFARTVIELIAPSQYAPSTALVPLICVAY